MQCYRTLAAVTRVATEIDTLPGVRHRLPYSVIADWMAENDIEADDVLTAGGDAVREIVIGLIERDRPEIDHAA